MAGRINDLSCQFKDSGVFNVNDATVWAWFKLDARNVSLGVLLCPKIVANRLFVNVQLRSNAGNAACGQCMLDVSQLFESQVHNKRI